MHKGLAPLHLQETPLNTNKLLFILYWLVSAAGFWLLGYLRVPNSNDSFSLVLSIVLGFTLFMGIFLVLFFKRLRQSTSNISRIAIASSLTIALVIGIVSYSLLQENKLLRSSLKKSASNLHLTAYPSPNQKTVLASKLMPQLIKQVKSELYSDSNGISPNSIRALSNLSLQLTPWRSDSSSSSANMLSPERGVLLTQLLALDLDSTSWIRIKQSVSFSHADLSNLDLSNIDFNFIDLSHASLSKTNLDGVSFHKANLKYALLNQAELTNARFTESKLNRADFTWARADSTFFEKCNLDGAILDQIQGNAVFMGDCSFKFGSATNAIFKASIFDRSSFEGSNLSKAQLNQASLKETELTDAILESADLKHSALDSATVRSGQWFSKEKTKGMIGKESIQLNYRLVASKTRKNRFVFIPK